MTYKEQALRIRIEALAAALRLALPHLDTDKDLSDDTVYRHGHPDIQRRRIALRVAQALLAKT